MPSKRKLVHFLSILLAVFVITIGYGVSFPLLAIQLEAMQMPAGLIGLNAAMPAFGWLILTPFLPRLHQRFSSKFLMLAFLVMALIGLAGFALTENFTLWLVLRFLFGGGLGLFFRVMEYWLNVTTGNDTRGRVIGIYTVCFMLGIVIGSLLQPELGTQGNGALAVIAGCLSLGAFLVALTPLRVQPPKHHGASLALLRSVALSAPLALAGVIAYGLYEDIPAYLLSIYTLKVGLGEEIAAYTLSAVVLGNLLFAIPLGVISDRIGRVPVLMICAIAGVLGAAAIPFLLGNPTAYLAVLALWGGFVGGLYSLSLAYIGDAFSDDALIAANAAIGTVYAAAAMIGPLINGMAMQLWEPQGLMVSCALIFTGFLIIYLRFPRIAARKGVQNVAS